MQSRIERPRPERVLEGLKDFQRETVGYVFSRIFADHDPAHRFLIADEVGLGKTLVTRGLIAKTVDHLWDKVERIDVVYICSNEDIARQNINRLNITGQEDFSHATRITMLPVQLKGLKHNKLNLISFTPGTSFDLGTSNGRAEERVLLYWMLDHVWGLTGRAPMNVFQGETRPENFRRRLHDFERRHEIDDALLGDFSRTLKARIDSDRSAGRPNLRARFDDLCDRFPRSDARATREDKQLRRGFIGELRMLLAETCIRALQPDLIVLDEFQRFKHLLEGKEATGELARDLFSYADEETNTAVRVLLLSATPYKMYTLSEESEEDDHYRDFLGTLRFLFNDQARIERVEHLIQEFRRELFRLGGHGPQQILDIKHALEQELRRVMVRTERLAVSEDRNGMLREIPHDDVAVEPRDLTAYLGLQRMARVLDQPEVLEYWKASPYVLNFMEEYEIKRAFTRECDIPEREAILSEVLQRHPALLLAWSDIEAYRRLDAGNARLRALLATTVDAGAWKLLWIAPSLPYYALAGQHAEPALKTFTKRLVFSAWRVVPKAIAILLSYEASRRAVTGFDAAALNTQVERERRQGVQLLRLGRDSDNRLTGMPVFGLMYPSIALAQRYDPLRWAGKGLPSAQGEPPAMESLLSRMEEALRAELEALAERGAPDGPPDEAWYWAAQILIDLKAFPGETRAWLGGAGLAAAWAGATPSDAEADSAWAEHVQFAHAVAEGRVRLGRRPADLARVVAELALAAPGTCALRALARHNGNASVIGIDAARLAAARVGWSFRNLFNHSETAALLRGIEAKEPYWRRVLQYCAEGGIQPMLDEYAHGLVESLGLIDCDSVKVAQEVGMAITEAVAVRPSLLGVDRISADGAGAGIDLARERMACRFAFQLAEAKAEEGDEPTRSEKVREAFNSPFWPFVLASTSIGQEGLDFHPYCHAIVHWNLPMNPVDMEQREGRIHRYKGHAVRKNLAMTYGAEVIAGEASDPWKALFDLGKARRPVGSNDLVPYWIFPKEDGAKIERHVPAYPLSRDRSRLENMRRSLAVYRMVFGQPRQEDLVAYLLEQLSSDEIETAFEQLRIDLSPVGGGDRTGIVVAGEVRAGSSPRGSPGEPATR